MDTICIIPSCNILLCDRQCAWYISLEADKIFLFYFCHQTVSYNFILNVCLGFKHKQCLNLNIHTYCIFIAYAYSSAFSYSVDTYCNISKFHLISVFILDTLFHMKNMAVVYFSMSIIALLFHNAHCSSSIYPKLQSRSDAKDMGQKHNKGTYNDVAT